MNIKLKCKILDAIEKVFDDACENDEQYWEDNLINPELISLMTDAAEIVFDSSMRGQEFEKQN